jgi:hypothetical protein
MKDPLDYDFGETIIKDGSILAEFKETHYWPVVKDLIESEIRVCFRSFLSDDESEESRKEFRSRAMGAKAILELIDGKISDMEVWVAQQQEKNKDDVNQVNELFNHHRSRMQAEVL